MGFLRLPRKLQFLSWHFQIKRQYEDRLLINYMIHDVRATEGDF
jgi:hypothetical protein